jgi:diguanylate cyclase (GGDEF)-like protein
VHEQPIDGTAPRVKAAHELAELTRLVDGARDELAQLRRDLDDARDQLGGAAAALLLEANENLVVAALRSQTEAQAKGQALEELSRASELDALTELPNRSLLLDRFTSAITHAKRHGVKVGLLFLDLNGFKEVNDTLGHSMGDEVLKTAARNLASAIRQGDTVSRHGGDEFVVLLGELTRAADAAVVANKIVTALGSPSRVGRHALRLSASIGISIYPDDAEDPATLINLADAAMYRAKRSHLGAAVFAGEVPADAPASGPHTLAALHRPLTDIEQGAAEHERRLALLREANSQLVLAALDAQELRAAAEKAQSRQTEYLVTLAHELRGPLAPIRSSAALLGHVRLHEIGLPKLRDIIERQVEHLGRMVDDLLDVSRANTGKLRLECSEIDLHSVVDEAVEGARPAMDLRLQELQLLMPIQPIMLWADRVRLAQILGNLFGNASKYTQNGGKIELSVMVQGEQVVISLVDNGIGINAEILPHIFEPFVQDPQAIGFNGMGLGVGLAVVRELVHAHGGEVVAHSAGSGRGSEFVVTLPLKGAPGT